jgi:hypothetical protein
VGFGGQRESALSRDDAVAIGRDDADLVRALPARDQPVRGAQHLHGADEIQLFDRRNDENDDPPRGAGVSRPRRSRHGGSLRVEHATSSATTRHSAADRAALRPTVA